MNIGNQLYELRKQKNLSQEEVAYQLNVTRQTISKWETNQSLPELDKIIPLCDLYGISADALLKGTNDINKNKEVVPDYKKEKAKVISTSVFLYFISVIWIIISESELIDNIDDSIQVSIFLLICAVSTAYLIYHMMSFPKKQEEPKTNSYKALDEIISLLFTSIYFLVSFTTKAWGITWIIWVIYAFIIQIIHLCLDLKGDTHGK